MVLIVHQFFFVIERIFFWTNCIKVFSRKWLKKHNDIWRWHNSNLTFDYKKSALIINEYNTKFNRKISAKYYEQVVWQKLKIKQRQEFTSPVKSTKNKISWHVVLSAFFSRAQFSRQVGGTIFPATMLSQVHNARRL